MFNNRFGDVECFEHVVKAVVGLGSETGVTAVRGKA